MVCVAKNTTSCDPKDKDIKVMMEALDQYRATADNNQCPYLTPDFCTNEAPCPFTTSNCGTDLERYLFNSGETVCE